VKRCGKSAWRWQGKPHTEQDQIGEDVPSGAACRLGAPQLPGRSLEPYSNVRPRGMIALPLFAGGRQNSAYRPGSYLSFPTKRSFDFAQDFGCGLGRPQSASTYRPGSYLLISKGSLDRREKQIPRGGNAGPSPPPAAAGSARDDKPMGMSALRFGRQGNKSSYFAGQSQYFSSQLSSSRTLILPCQGFWSSEWPSSGKTSSELGMPSVCSACSSR